MKKNNVLVLLSACLLSGIFYSCSGDGKVNKETQESSLDYTVGADNEALKGLALPLDTNFVFKKCEIIDNVYTNIYEAKEHATSYEKISNDKHIRELFKFIVFRWYHNSDERLNDLSENKTAVGYRLIWPDGNQLDYIFPFDEVKEITSAKEFDLQSK